MAAKAQPAEVAKLQDWSLSPSGKLTGDPAGSLALGMAPAAGLNGSDLAQAEAASEFRALIEPVINPARFAELHQSYPRKGDLIRHLASETQLSRRTVYRRLHEWEKGGITGLARKMRADKGQSRVLNPASVNFIISAVLPKAGSYGELSNADVWRHHEEERRWRDEHIGKVLSRSDRVEYAGYVDANGQLLPSARLSEASYSTFCRTVGKIPELIKLMARRGQEGYRDAELLSFRDLGSIEPLDYVVMDDRLLDIFCLIPERGGWKLARPWLTAAIDMSSRKWLGWCVVETPSSDSIATVLKRVFVNWGLPKACYWDNGRSYRCHWLEGRRENSRVSGPGSELPSRWAGVLETLDIRVHHAIVRRARSKIIEPCFGAIADFDKTLPEWAGHKPGARPERFDELLLEHEAWLAGKRSDPPFRTIAEVAGLYDLAINDLNEREHRGEGMRKVTVHGMGWMCPNEAWELGIKNVERRSVPEDVLQLCFAKRKELTVRNGEIQITFSGRQYHYRLTGNRTALLGLNDRKIELAYDALDLGKAAVYYEGGFIGLAECVPLRRMSEDAFVQDERDRRTTRREVKRFIAAVHQAVPVPDPETYLRRRAAVAPVRTDPQRVEVQAQLPAPIAEASAARAAEAAFSFAAVEATIPSVAPTPDDDSDTEFNFFSR